jgi:hypothetical protein
MREAQECKKREASRRRKGAKKEKKDVIFRDILLLFCGYFVAI